MLKVNNIFMFVNKEAIKILCKSMKVRIKRLFLNVICINYSQAISKHFYTCKLLLIKIRYLQNKHIIWFIMICSSLYFYYFFQPQLHLKNIREFLLSFAKLITSVLFMFYTIYFAKKIQFNFLFCLILYYKCKIVHCRIF